MISSFIYIFLWIVVEILYYKVKHKNYEYFTKNFVLYLNKEANYAFVLQKLKMLHLGCALFAIPLGISLRLSLFWVGSIGLAFLLIFMIVGFVDYLNRRQI